MSVNELNMMNDEYDYDEVNKFLKNKNYKKLIANARLDFK